MVDSIRIALCQIRPVVGDLEGNVAKIVEAHAISVAAGVQLSVFPELALSGLMPRDLLLRDDFLTACEDSLEDLRRRLDPAGTVIIGMPMRARSIAGGPGVEGASGFEDWSSSGDEPVVGDTAERAVWDAAVVITGGRITTTTTRTYLGNRSPNQDLRYFSAGPRAFVVVDGVEVIVAVGDELIEVASHLERSADGTRPRIIVDVMASPFTLSSSGHLADTASRVATMVGCPVAVVNGVGGNDQFVFDGASVVVDVAGRVIAESGRFVESIDVVDVPLSGDVPSSGGGSVELDTGSVDTTDRIDAGVSPGVRASGRRIEPTARGLPDWDSVDLGDVWTALVTGIAHYVELNGFPAVGLGLSGGVDSALVATLATEAVGPDRVHCVMMPSRYSSEGSVTDATDLAENLGVAKYLIPIEPAHVAFETMLAEPIGGEVMGLTEENLQARIRGMTLMALSNEFGWLILVGGNRSEARVGYSTLYGDSAGGLAPISDIDKLGVYALCRWYNERCATEGSHAVIPESILTKAPSAELRPGQRDDQSLPPYDVLDPLLGMYVEERRSRSELVDAGFDPAVVERVTGLVDRSEYKRQQMPPGIIVSRCGPSYRSDLPITSRWRP